MAGLQLPFTFEGDAIDPSELQANFDAVKKEFPLSRKNIKVEAPKKIGAAGEPAFANGWQNFDAVPGFQNARYWKDAMGIVYVDGLIKLGTLNLPAFTLPVGYRPAATMIFTQITNGAIGRVDILNTGTVVPATPSSNVWVNLSGIFFRQEL